jgi:hypothetical protein
MPVSTVFDTGGGGEFWLIPMQLEGEIVILTIFCILWHFVELRTVLMISDVVD